MSQFPPEPLVIPPFPELVREPNGGWTGRDKLPSWAGFQQRLGPYASVSSREVSDGTIKIHVIAAADSPVPSIEQIAAYQYLKEYEESVAGTVLDAIWYYYEKLPERYGLDERDTARHFRRTQRHGFRRLIGLNCVHILSTAKSGVAYVGFELGCDWDPEHGLGVMTHQNRAIEASDATCSFQSWRAQHDANAGGDV